MKLVKEISIILATAAIVACGSSKKIPVKPVIATEPVDSTAYKSVAINADSSEYAESDTIVTDSLIDSIPLIKATHSWKKDLRDGIDELLEDPVLETSVVGIDVWDLDDDVRLYSHGERQRLRPASTMKTVTAIAALKELGSDYKFTTGLYYDGNEPDSARTWKGNIYVVGGMDPKISSQDVDNFAKAIKELGVDSITGDIYADQSFKDNKKYGSGWCWDDEDLPLLLPLTYKNHDEFTDILRQKLRDHNIVVTGGWGTKTVPSGARLITKKERRMTSVMRPMLKNSNNKYAESVFFAIAHKASGNGASASSTSRVVKSILTDMGAESTNSYDIADGSGLSLYNYVTPEMEVMMLRYAWKHREIFNTLYPLLPIAARDGTLRKRMHGTKAAGNVHAKTGTVEGIRSLCGYLTASNGHRIAFSIINQGVTNSDGTVEQARSLQNKICELLCQ